MKKFLLLLLLLSPLTLRASSFDFSSGQFDSGTLSQSGMDFSIAITGSLDSTSLSTTTLGSMVPCFNGYECQSFSSGVITVKSPSGATVFSDSLTSGAVITKGDAIFVIGILAPSDPLKGILSFAATLGPGGIGITNGEAIVVGSSTVPEPSGLALLGGGLVGLAGLKKLLQ
jgi:hypothetical protein